MSETSDRVSAVRQRMADSSLDALLITHPSNRIYLTGFTGDDTAPNESSGHLILTQDAAVLITGSVNVTQATAQAPHIRVILRQGGWIGADAQELLQHEFQRIGYEADAITEAVFRGVGAQLVAHGRTVEWVPCDGLVEELRAVKSPAEIALLRRAYEITNEAFDRVAATIQAGQTEREIAWKLNTAMVELGAEGPSFPTIVAAGTNAARPHHEPGQYRVREGEPIVIDMGARYEGYCADLTRTTWVGEPDPKLREVYAVVEGAVEAALERVQPGSSGQDIDNAARSWIAAHGYGEAFGHGLGHGVGLRVHEAPSASPQSTDIFMPGQIITLEPGVYLPEWGGVRIEDAVLITEFGIEVLTSASKKLV